MQAIDYNVPFQTQFPITPVITPRTENQRLNQAVRIAVCVAGNPFLSQNDLVSATEWNARLAATDETRIVLSPLFSNSKLTPSKKLETGADTNATYRGLPIYFGEGVAMFSGEFQDCDADAIDTFFSIVAPFSMQNGVGPASLVMWICNNDGHICSTPDWDGLPCINLSVRSRGSDGLNSSDKAGFDCYLPPNWDGGETSPTMSNVKYLNGTVDLRSYP